ncbi:MAG: dihydropteroate synthase [Dysgonamonadaceae bacterium]|jgi:dihydropteroate synthase|nr:dihydropteroate synthase [Dysgonamonadaceae bacterium]
MTSNIKGKLTGFVSPKVMGILNITPDSFYEGSRKQTEKEIAERVVQIVEEGADIIDAGGYSSRPSAAYVDEAEEMRRLKYGLEILFREAPDAIVSVDTFRSEIARRCVEDFGVAIINDISAGALDGRMFETVAGLQVPYIAMHMKGSPQTMMEHTDYANLTQEILLYFAEKVNRLHQTGVNDVWIDPGFGFSKTTAQNYTVLDRLEEFHIFGLPLLVGFSRKTMIREVLATAPAESLNGTTGLNMFALTKGAHILRVHDVKEAVQTVRLYKRIKNQNYD